MRRLIFKLIIPITIISFALFTKWWYCLPVDAPDTMYWGFPFIYAGWDWGSSMTVQIFIIEFIADLFVYFSFWFLLTFGINRFLIKIKPYKALTLALWCLSVIIIGLAALIWSVEHGSVYAKRPYDLEIMDTGHEFLWENIPRPDYYQYRPEKKQ